MATQLETSRDRINRSTYASLRARRMYEHLHDYSDPGERAALERVAKLARGRPILDLGVGAGRTVPLLRAISHDYVALDYTPSLVEACKQRHPLIDVRVGDARDLSAFPAGRFFLVVFSWNGIDSVSHADRARILREIHRVLAPGGVCVFSAHNYDGPVQRRSGFEVPRLSVCSNPLRLAARSVRYGYKLGLSLVNRQRHRRFEQHTAGYLVANSGAHEYGLMIHHVKLSLQLQQLRALGFDGVDVFSCVDGAPVAEGDDTSEVTWFHFVARKPQASARAVRTDSRKVRGAAARGMRSGSRTSQLSTYDGIRFEAALERYVQRTNTESPEHTVGAAPE